MIYFSMKFIVQPWSSDNKSILSLLNSALDG